MGQRKSLFLAVAFAIAISTLGCNSHWWTGQSASPDTSDASAQLDMQNKLASEPSLTGMDIRADVKGGVATLTGSVSSADARTLAGSDASQVPGVRVVVNDLVVGPATPSNTVAAPAPAAATPAAVPAPAVRTRTVVVYRDRKAPAAVAPAAYAAASQPSPAASPTPVATAVAPLPETVTVTLPAGTIIPIRNTQYLTSATARAGQTFQGGVASNVIQNGVVAIPYNSFVSGRVVVAKDAGHFAGNASLSIELTELNLGPVGGYSTQAVPLDTEPLNFQGKGRGSNTAEKVGGGAALGAIIGALAGGGKGAAIGAIAGGGAGAGVNALTHGQQVEIASETLLNFRLAAPVTITVKNRPPSPPPSGLITRGAQ